MGGVASVGPVKAEGRKWIALDSASRPAEELEPLKAPRLDRLSLPGAVLDPNRDPGFQSLPRKLPALQVVECEGSLGVFRLLFC